jgi:predicted transcriptional regulator
MSKISREKILERLPFCFGVIQRIADDLNVSHSAVSMFLKKPENADIKHLIKNEKKRMKQYAEMTVMKHLISGDIETAKWYLSTFRKNPERKKSRGRGPGKQNDYILLSETAAQQEYRELSFALLDFTDSALPNSITKFLPENLKKELKENNNTKQYLLEEGKEKKEKI